MPLLSVIIPTHERFRYASETVENLLGMPDDIEIVVSDTSLLDPWQEARYRSSSQLKIVRPGANISVVDNFNRALEQASGDYICFIGDDDLVSPDIIEIVGWAQKEAVEAVRLTFPVLFYWPDYHHRTQPEAYAGTVWADRYTGMIRPLDARESLGRAAGRLGHGVFDMPRAYCGIVSRTLVERIIAQHGTLFGGVSPDIYSAALLAAHARTIVEIDFPAVIPGASGASTAGHSAAGRHVGALRDNAHIRPFRDLVWHPFVPEFYSVPTVWSYSLVRALEQIPSGDAPRPNWGRLYAQCVLYHRRHWPETWRAMLAYAAATSPVRLVAETAGGISAELAWGLGRVKQRIAVRRRKTRARRIGEVDGIGAAAAVVQQIIRYGPRPRTPR